MHLTGAKSVNSPVTVGVSSNCLAGSLLNVKKSCLQTQSDTLQLCSIGRGLEGLLDLDIGLVLRLRQQAGRGLGCCRAATGSYRGGQVIP